MPSEVRDTWEQGEGYERYIGRWSRRVAPLFLPWLGIPPGKRWLDVGCGTGALSAAILDHCAPLSVTGVEPSAGFISSARERLGDRVVLHQGSATQLPLDDGSMDVAVSGLVLNFVPDQRAAVAEMARVVGPGGTIGAYVWDYAEKMELIRFFWDAAVALDPDAAQLDEARRFPLCRPDPLHDLFAGAGLAAVDATGIEIPTPFASFDEYWRSFLGAQGPAPSYAMSLDEVARERLRERLRERVPVGVDGASPLIARAWAVRGTVPGGPGTRDSSSAGQNRSP